MNYEPEKFWNERYAHLDLTRSGHRDLPEPYNRWLYRRKQDVLRETLAATGFVLRGRRVLEVGVGLGAYVDFWRAQGAAEVAGVDLSAAAVADLQRRYPGQRFERCDITEPEAMAQFGRFGLVTALDVLYHVVDDTKLARALANIAARLDDDGLFAFHDQFLHRPSEDHRYIRWRSLADWERLLAAAGFEVVARRPIFFTMIQANDGDPVELKRADARWVRRAQWIGRFPWMSGAVLRLVDASLARGRDEGPSMELMIARRARQETR